MRKPCRTVGFSVTRRRVRVADFVCGCASIGHTKSCKEVLAIVQQIINSQGAEIEVSKGWWDTFRRRPSELTFRHSEALSYARVAANNPKVVHKYFDLLQQTMEENGLMHWSTQVFNCDESGLILTHRPPKVVAWVGQKQPYAVTSGDKAQTTILACGNATGYGDIWLKNHSTQIGQLGSAWHFLRFVQRWVGGHRTIWEVVQKPCTTSQQTTPPPPG